MLYTFLLQHKNSTCIRQVDGDNITDALEKWVPTLENHSMGVGENKAVLDLEEVKTEIAECKPVLLRNLQSVWCAHMRFKDKDALVTIVLNAVPEDALAFPES